MRNRHHQLLRNNMNPCHLWDVVATVLAAVLVHAAAVAGAPGAGAEDQATVGHPNPNYSPQFLTYVGNVIDDLVRVHNAFWTEGQWYNMTLKSDQDSAQDSSEEFKNYHQNQLFSLFYDKPGAVQVITDPTGVYDNKKKKRDLPFIYQSAPPAVPCKNAASTSIISGSKAVDFASFAIGIMTLVININNNINNNNNNNNNLNLNAIDSSNIVANFNTNNANQVNIMPPGGRRRKRSVMGSTAIMIMAVIQAALKTSHENASKNEVPNTKFDLTNDPIVSKVQQIVIDKMIKNPKSKVMAGCSDMHNCQRRLSLFI